MSTQPQETQPAASGGEAPRTAAATRSAASGAAAASRTARRGRHDDDGGPRATFSQLMPYLFEHKPVLGLAIGLSVLAAAASLTQPFLVGRVISVVQSGDPLGSLVWLIVAIVVATALLNGFQHYLLQRTGTSVVFSARKQLVRRILRLPISQFDARRTGDLVSRVGSDTTLLYAVITQGLVDAVGGVLIFVGAIIAMLVIDPVLLGLTVLVIAVSVVAVVLLSARIRIASRRQQEKVGDLTAAVERAISSVRTVRAANATDREIDSVEKNAEGAWRMGLAVAKISALVVPIAGIALQVSLLVVLGVGGYRVANGAIDIAGLVSFILFLFMMIMPLGQAFGAISSVNQALGALGRIQEIIALPSESENDASIEPSAPIETDAAISFHGVEFSYPEEVVLARRESADGHADATPAYAEASGEGVGTRAVGTDSASITGGEAGQPAGVDRVVLRGVSFGAPRGRRTALVGPSGAGKSTTLALIERFYDPTAGVVRLAGVDIRGLDREALRAQIGYVEQDAPVLAGTLRENLLLGDPSASDEECIRVLREVNLTEVLERNPLGLDAPVGEGGVMLSGGERQRLAIARALVAAPPILLLDESTSSLDGMNEQLLREAIDAVAENRTLIVIAHRLSTVVDSDQIVVFEHGRVIGVGTHSELVRSTPLYRDLAKHQLLV